MKAIDGGQTNFIMKTTTTRTKAKHGLGRVVCLTINNFGASRHFIGDGVYLVMTLVLSQQMKTFVRSSSSTRSMKKEEKNVGRIDMPLDITILVQSSTSPLCATYDTTVDRSSCPTVGVGDKRSRSRGGRSWWCDCVGLELPPLLWFRWGTHKV